MSKLASLALGAALGVLLASGGADAAVINTFNTKADFDAAVGATGLETFGGSQTPGTGASGGNLWTLPFLTIETPYDTTPAGDTGVTNGAWRGQPTGILADIIKFNRPIVAFAGMFDTEVGGNGGGIDIRVEIDLMLGSQLVGTIGAGNNPNTAFLGFASTETFDTIRINFATEGSSARDTYTLDNVQYQVPEPASLALLGAGLAGLGLMRRRKGA